MTIIAEMAIRSLRGAAERSFKGIKSNGEVATHITNARLDFADEPHTTDKLVRALRKVNLALQATTGQPSALSNEISLARIALCDLIVLTVVISAGHTDRGAFFDRLECDSLDKELKSQLAHS